MPLLGTILIAGQSIANFYFIGNKSYPFGDNSNKCHGQCTYLLSKLNFRVFKASTIIFVFWECFLDIWVEHVSIVWSWSGTDFWSYWRPAWSWYFQYLYKLLWECTKSFVSLFFWRGHFDWPITNFFSKYWALPQSKKHRGASLWPIFIICNICVFVWNFNFGQSIWDKSVVPLGTSWQNLSELDGNTFEIARKETVDGMHQSNTILV
jgi:hypothetical protein